MLNRGINKKHYLLFLFYIILAHSCQNNSNSNLYKEKSTALIGETEYSKLYNSLRDTLSIWKLNKLFGSIDTSYSVLYIDSLLCVNSTKDRVITCLLNKYVNKVIPSVADGIFYLYGEKILNKWYFFKGTYIHVERESIKGHPVKKPLSYQQLHQIALKEVYSGYLKKNGEINEDWFTSQFEGPGWANWDDTPQKIKSYTRKDYEQFHLKVVRNNWNGVKKDSISNLPDKTVKLP